MSIAQSGTKSSTVEAEPVAPRITRRQRARPLHTAARSDGRWRVDHRHDRPAPPPAAPAHAPGGLALSNPGTQSDTACAAHGAPDATNSGSVGRRTGASPATRRWW